MDAEYVHHDLISAFEVVASHIHEARKNKWTGIVPVRVVIDIDIPKYVAKYLKEFGYDVGDYTIKTSCGKCGRWTNIIYIAILENNVCLDYARKVSPRYGVYPGFFFNQNCNKVYLLLEQAVTGRSSKELCDVKLLLQSNMTSEIFSTDVESVKLGVDPGNYAQGAIYYKEYDVNSFPSNEQLKNDFEEMMKLYSQYIKTLYKSKYVNPKYSTV